MNVAHEEIEAAAMASIAGIPPLAILNERDPFMRGVFQRITERSIEIRRQLDEELAQRIIANLGKAIKK
jgi:hypothetical protein